VRFKIWVVIHMNFSFSSASEFWQHLVVVEKSADVSEGHIASIFWVEVMIVNDMIYIGNGGQGQDDVQNRNNPKNSRLNPQQNSFRNFKSHTGINLLRLRQGLNKKLEGVGIVRPYTKGRNSSSAWELRTGQIGK